MSAPVLSWLFNALRKGASFKKSTVLCTAGGLDDRSSAQSVKTAQSNVSHHPIATETHKPNPQSQSFSRGYGSILPTSLIYIVLSTRGCSPWRPDAVMSTTRGENHVSPGFSRAVERAQDTTNMQCFPSGRTLSPAKLIPG